MSDLVTFRLTATGRVQGVGFRPFVCRTAKALGLTGWVKNWGGIVEIRASGKREAFFSLAKALKGAPYPIFVESIRADEVPYTAFDGFSAIESGGQAVEPLFPADIGISLHRRPAPSCSAGRRKSPFLPWRRGYPGWGCFFRPMVFMTFSRKAWGHPLS